MKVFAVNGSPRKKKSNTDRLLLPFIQGCEEAGAEVDLVYLQEKKIKPCLGCFTCWLKTPGVCVQKDDMAGILELMRDADLVVLATPLYIFGMTAQMKTMFDRIIPLVEPFIEIKDGNCTHLFREGFKRPPMVIVSNCGFHEMENFNEMMQHFRVIAKLGGQEILAALLRPAGEMLPVLEQLSPRDVKPIYDAAREAGRQAVEKGSIDPALVETFGREFIPREEFLKAANAYFKSQIEQAQAGS